MARNTRELTASWKAGGSASLRLLFSREERPIPAQDLSPRTERLPRILKDLRSYLRPTLANTLKRLASAVQLRPWPPHFKKNLFEFHGTASVRSRSASEASLKRLMRNRSGHFPRCDHTIAADCVGVELNRQPNVTVAKQGLHRLWIGSDAGEKMTRGCGADYEIRIVAGRHPRVRRDCPRAMKESLP